MALASSLSVLVTVAGNTAHFDYLETPVGHLAPAEHEWAQHLKDNLDVDMTYWRQRGRLKANATMELYEQIMKRRLTAVFKLVLVYKNQIYYPLRDDPQNPEPPLPCAPQAALLEELRGLAEAALQLAGAQ